MIKALLFFEYLYAERLNIDWLYIIECRSSEKVESEITFFFSSRFRLFLLWFFLLWLFFLFGLLLLLFFFSGGGSRSWCSKWNFGESFADDLYELLCTSSTFLLLREVRTAFTCASSTGFPVAFKIAIKESLAVLCFVYLELFLKGWRGQGQIRTASLMVNI